MADIFPSHSATLLQPATSQAASTSMSHWPSATGTASGTLPHQFSDQGRMLQVCKLAVATVLYRLGTVALHQRIFFENVSKFADVGFEPETFSLNSQQSFNIRPPGSLRMCLHVLSFIQQSKTWCPPHGLLCQLAFHRHNPNSEVPGDYYQAFLLGILSCVDTMFGQGMRLADVPLSRLIQIFCL